MSARSEAARSRRRSKAPGVSALPRASGSSLVGLGSWLARLLGVVPPDAAGTQFLGTHGRADVEGGEIPRLRRAVAGGSQHPVRPHQGAARRLPLSPNLKTPTLGLPFGCPFGPYRLVSP